MRNKFLALLACSALALGLAPSAAFAVGNEAAVDGVEYATVSAAVENANEGDTVTLLQDATLTNTISLNKNLTFDLGGHTLTHNNTILDLYANATIQNGTMVMNGNNNGSAIWLNGDAQLIVAADVEIMAINSPSIHSFAIGFWSDCDGASLELNGRLSGEEGFTFNGNIKAPNTLTINDGASINVEGTALYLAGYGTTAIVGNATLTGSEGIEIRAGNLTIDGATVTATGTFSEAPNGNGATTTGVALAVSQHTTNQPINVTVNSGTFTGEKAFYEVDLQDETATEDVALNITGGTFNGDVASENHTEFISAGTFDRPVTNNLIATGKTEANLTSGATTTYYIGDNSQVATELAAAVQPGDTIEVTQGDLKLENLPAGITVKNTGKGEVIANNMVATAEGVTTMELAETDSEGVSPQTSDLNTAIVFTVMVGALLALSLAYRSQRKARR